MLHWWLIPVLGLFFLLVGILYLVVKSTGGTGVRTEGKTLFDKPDDQPPFGNDRD